jgi:hypothetical protein
MDGIFACLQKPKLGHKPKGTLHGEWCKEKRNTNKAMHGTSQFSKAMCHLAYIPS